MMENSSGFERRRPESASPRGADELVDACLLSLRRAVPERSPERDQRRAFQLLVGWARLLRIRPEVLARLDRDGLVGRAERVIGERSRTLVELAVRDKPSKRWLEEAERLAASYEELVEPGWRSEQASRLLAALDDLELICFAAGRLEKISSGLTRWRDTCRGWLAARIDTFLAAGQVARLTRGALREDLRAFDGELARSAEKYGWVEDAWERANAELNFAGQPGLGREDVAELVRSGGSEAPVRGGGALRAEPWRWTEETWGRVGAATGGERSGPWIRWESPDAKLVARLMVDHRSGGGVCVEFLQADDDRRPARWMAGQAVRLAGVAGRIDEAGAAVFAARELKEQAGPEATLEVGDRAGRWTRMGR